MAKHIVICRCCKQKFDAQIEDKDKIWVMPSKNYYYHKNCYDDWTKKKNDVHSQADDDLWFDALWDYLSKDIKIGPDFVKVKSQWDNLIKKGKTPKGIYFCTKYFYDIKKGDPKKSEHGIGIISYIYEEGAAYWIEKEQKDKGICARIEEQIRQSQNREKKIVKKIKEKKVKTYDLSDI